MHLCMFIYKDIKIIWILKGAGIKCRKHSVVKAALGYPMLQDC